MSHDHAQPPAQAPAHPPIKAPPGDTPLRLVPLSAEVLHALLRGDLKTATVVAGVPLTPHFVEHQWLWDIRVAQLERDPASQNWIARAAVHRDAVVGHVGFHGPPDERGMVEVAYSVDPQYRRRGYGRRMLAAALLWAGQDPSVKIVRATIGPANVASIATLGAFPFEPVGEQWDDEDGLELVYELPLAPDHVQGPGDY